MLREVMASLLTPAGRHARRMGYVREGVGIESRHRRCRSAWADHLEQSRRSVINSARACSATGVAVVLGSGALLDVPLAALADTFDQVFCLDLFHPWSARLAVRRYPHVHLITHDLLGIDEDGDPWAAPQRLRRWREAVPSPDFVVSLNLLTQLPLRPLEKWGEALGVSWMEEVMAAHLDDLRNGPGRACLISEVVHRTYDRSGRLVDQDDVLAGLSLPKPDHRWVWHLAPLGELSAGERLEMDVGAFCVSASDPCNAVPQDMDDA